MCGRLEPLPRALPDGAPSGPAVEEPDHLGEGGSVDGVGDLAVCERVWC